MGNPFDNKHKDYLFSDIENSDPTVSIILPVFNEERYIYKCLDTLLNQDYKNIVELIVVDAISTDNTRYIVNQYAREHRHLKIVDNPAKVQTTGFNHAYNKAKGDIIVRADAHATYATDYVSQSVRCLLEKKAGAVGGAMRITTGDRIFEKAIGFIHYSKFGIGVAKFHDPHQESWVKTVWLGTYPKHLLKRLGGYREYLVRSEDIDLNQRLRKLGYGIYLSKSIIAYYVPRKSLKELARQSFGTGKSIIVNLLLNPKSLSFYHLVPLIFVGILLVSSILLGLCSVFKMKMLYTVISLVLATSFISYILTALFFSVQISSKRGVKYLPVLLIVFFTLHFSYGLGSIFGLITTPKWYQQNKDKPH